MTLADILRDYFNPAFCAGCGETAPCYTDPETGYPLCLPCLEVACEAARFGLHYTDPVPDGPR